MGILHDFGEVQGKGVFSDFQLRGMTKVRDV